MFVINRVVLERFEERTKIMGLGDENTIVAQEGQNSGHDVVDIFDVGENVRRRDDLSFSLFSRRLSRDFLCKKRNHRWNPALDRQFRGVGRLNPKHAHAVFLEVAQERAVVGTDVDDQLIGFERIKGFHFAREFGKVLAKDFRRAAGVWIRRWKKNCRIHDQSELGESAVLAKQQLRGISRLFCQWRTNDRHRIHGREIAEE